MQQCLHQPAVFQDGRLISHSKAWLRHLKPSRQVQRWLLDGYSEYLQPLPKSLIQQDNQASCLFLEALVTREVQALLACGAVEDVTAVRDDFEQVAAVLPLLVAEDPRRKGQAVLEWQSHQPVFALPFKLEHAPKAAALMKPGDFMLTIDMKSGYHKIPLKSSFKRFCCFAWADKIYRWIVPPFGLSSAPRVYTKLSRCMLAFWRAKSIRVSNYIDDFQSYAASLQEALELRDKVLKDMATFGWHISLSKSHLNPGQTAWYVGFEFCSVPQCHVKVPTPELQALAAKLKQALSQHQQHAA